MILKIKNGEITVLKIRNFELQRNRFLVKDYGIKNYFTILLQKKFKKEKDPAKIIAAIRRSLQNHLLKITFCLL